MARKRESWCQFSRPPVSRSQPPEVQLQPGGGREDNSRASGPIRGRERPWWPTGGQAGVRWRGLEQTRPDTRPRPGLVTPEPREMCDGSPVIHSHTPHPATGQISTLVSPHASPPPVSRGFVFCVNSPSRLMKASKYNNKTFNKKVVLMKERGDILQAVALSH